MPDYMKLATEPEWWARVAREQHKRRLRRRCQQVLEGVATGYLPTSELRQLAPGYACWAVRVLTPQGPLTVAVPAMEAGEPAALRAYLMHRGLARQAAHHDVPMGALVQHMVRLHGFRFVAGPMAVQDREPWCGTAQQVRENNDRVRQLLLEAAPSCPPGPAQDTAGAAHPVQRMRRPPRLEPPLPAPCANHYRHQGDCADCAQARARQLRRQDALAQEVATGYRPAVDLRELEPGRAWWVMCVGQPGRQLRVAVDAAAATPYQGLVRYLLRCGLKEAAHAADVHPDALVRRFLAQAHMRAEFGPVPRADCRTWCGRGEVRRTNTKRVRLLLAETARHWHRSPAQRQAALSACAAKHPYPGRHGARIVAAQIGRRIGQPLYVYQCGTCAHWHLTRTLRDTPPPTPAVHCPTAQKGTP